MDEESIFSNTYYDDDPLKDLYPRFPEELEYLDYLERQKDQPSMTTSEQNLIPPQSQINPINLFDTENHQTEEQTKAQHKNEDYDCMICGDGDYSDGNQIVFCARCNISVHEQCYGLDKIPGEGFEWVCDLCRCFGPEGEHLPCPLCNVRGGAMRSTSIHSFDKYWKNNNVEYYKMMRLQKHEYDDEGRVAREEDNRFLNQKEVHVQKQSKEKSHLMNTKNYESLFYYNYQKPSRTEVHHTVDGQEDPVLFRPPIWSWIHMSCLHWIPEVQFSVREQSVSSEDDEELEIQRSQIEKMIVFDSKLDVRRFRLNCSICQTENGACIQCSKGQCQASFHVECARKAQIFMEFNDAEKSRSRFIIYCKTHAPLEVKRAIESKRHTSMQEIIKFCKALEKFYDQDTEKYEQIPDEQRLPEITYYPKQKMVKAENKDMVSLIFKSGVRSQDLHRDSKMEKLRRENRFIREIEYELNRFEEFGNVIKLTWSCVPSDKNDGSLERVYSVAENYYEQPSKAYLVHPISKNHHVWNQFAERRGLKAKSVYDKYKRIVMFGAQEDEREGLVEKKRSLAFPKNFNLLAESETHYGGNKNYTIINGTDYILDSNEDDLDTEYCICKKPWKGEMIIECETCNEWFHPACVQIFGDEEEIKKINFSCLDCRKKNEAGSTEKEENLGKRDPNHGGDEKQQYLSEKLLKVSPGIAEITFEGVPQLKDELAIAHQTDQELMAQEIEDHIETSQASHDSHQGKNIAKSTITDFFSQKKQPQLLAQSISLVFQRNTTCIQQTAQMNTPEDYHDLKQLQASIGLPARELILEI